MLKQEQIKNRKPPLTPRQACIMSLVVFVGGIPIGILAYFLLLEPLYIVVLWYAGIVYLAVGLSWSFLEWRTRNRVIRAWNVFIAFIALLILFLAFTQKDHEPFPRYGIFLIVLGGVIVAAVMGVTALQNFRRWRKGNFQIETRGAQSEDEKTRDR